MLSHHEMNRRGGGKRELGDHTSKESLEPAEHACTKKKALLTQQL